MTLGRVHTFVKRVKRLPVWTLDTYSSYRGTHRERRRPATPALNIGTGGVDLPGWINLDETKPGDILAAVPPLPFRSNCLAEVLASHVLEHMRLQDGSDLLSDCHRVLKPGGRITVVVPDTRVIAIAYLLGQVSNESLNNLYLYSYIQESPHRWSYDGHTLGRLMRDAGFENVRRLNRFSDPVLMHPAPYQVCVSGIKPI